MATEDDAELGPKLFTNIVGARQTFLSDSWKVHNYALGAADSTIRSLGYIGSLGNWDPDSIFPKSWETYQRSRAGYETVAAIPLLFYGYQGVLGRDIMWLDVAIFQIAVLLGFWVTWAMLRRRALASPVWQVAGAAVLAAVWAAFILWTFAPPDLPLFADPETGLRGIR